MRQIKPLNEIFNIKNCDELVSEFYFYVSAKKQAQQQLNDVEEVVYLLINMLPDIEMEGFIDLFHQLYSLRECVVVESNLRRFHLHKLTDLFREAKSIYLNERTSITEEEYRQIGALIPNENQSRRFDEIGEMILAEDSEIYQLSDPLCKYVMSNREALLHNNV